MTETQIPADVSIAEQRAEHDIDAKLREGAERARRNREAKAARGEPEPLASIEARVQSWLDERPHTDDAETLADMPVHAPQPRVSAAWRAAMVTPRFRASTFASFEMRSNAHRAALDGVKGWVTRALAGEPAMLALVGSQGVGKSHLLYAAANALLGEDRKVYARPWYRLADELRYGGPNPVTLRSIEAADVRQMLWSQDIVCLDEVRPTASTAFDDTELAKFACHAYDSNLAVLITTNVSPLSDVMGPAAASRFTQVVVTGPDRRQA